MARPLSAARVAISILVLEGIAFGARADSSEPLRLDNWAAPATWAPSARASGKRTLDVTNPLPFIALAPCRILDTRGNGFTGSYGPPAMSADSPRSFTLTGRCGIPPGAGAVSLNVTVTSTAGLGYILIYPQGALQPVVSTLNYLGGQTVANAAVVPLGSGGGVTVVAGISGAQLIIDTNGYYAETPAISSDGLQVVNAGHFAVSGQTSGSGVNDAGVYGVATSTSGVTDGVFGRSFSSSNFSAGVLAVSEATTGMTFGIFSRTNSTTAGAVGAYGEAVGSGGRTYGVQGVSLGGFDSAGVYGISASGAPSLAFSNGAVGVRGDGVTDAGVLGISSGNTGVEGLKVSGGGIVAAGYLGTTAVSSLWGVYAFGNIGASGTKPFVEVHPTDPTRVIRYVALEGPEAGTYFRGSETTSHGLAVIPVPESFRLVTDAEGMTVQLTPVGAPATMYVVSQDLNQIVVRSSRDVKFHYMVNGVRQTFKDWQVIVDGSYMPDSPAQTLPAYFSDAQKQRLISNGTYNADGTVNMETAARAGWTRTWAEREERSRAKPSDARR